MIADFIRFDTEVVRLAPIVTSDAIKRSMGIPDGERVKKRLQRYIDEVVEIARAKASPRLIWRCGDVETVKGFFGSSRRLDKALRGADRVAVTASTVGRDWEARALREKDPIKAYALESASTALARASLLQTGRALKQCYFASRIGLSLSPGNEGVPLSLQRGVAEFLPLERIGVSMDLESLFMRPLASVTAIFPIRSQEGGEEEPVELCDETLPNCSRCPSAGCQLRVDPYLSNRNQISNTNI